MTTFRPLVLFALLFALSSRAHATVLVGTDLGQLAHEAVAIARGRVASVDARWTEGRRSIETIVTLDVESTLKGTLGPSVQFRVPGGDLGRLRSIVVGAPAFEVDERVVVFLGAQGPIVPYVLGLSQGVYRVVPTASRTGWLVTPPPLLPVAAATAVVRGDIARRPMPLSDFEQRVRALAGGAR